MAKILLIEDDGVVSQAIQAALEMQNHHVDIATSGKLGREYIRTGGYDLIVLDRNLPEISGTEICLDYRKKGGNAAILMLTGLGSTDQKIEGLESGADDYLAKPFELRELLARVQALLRRPAQIVSEHFRAGEILVDAGSGKVFVNSEEVHLKPLDFQVLQYLMRNSNKVVSPAELLKRVWSVNSEVSLEAVYNSINRIRKRLGPAADKVIHTVHGLGYRIDA